MLEYKFVIQVNIYISDFSHVTLLGESTYLQKQVCTAFDKATSVYTLFFILGKKACCLDREKSQNPLVKCKICRRSDILNFSYTILTVNDVTEESQGSHPKGGISGKLVKPPLIY